MLSLIVIILLGMSQTLFAAHQDFEYFGIRDKLNPVEMAIVAVERSDVVRKKKEAELDTQLNEYESNMSLFLGTNDFNHPQLTMSPDLAKSIFVTTIVLYPFEIIPLTQKILEGSPQLKARFNRVSLKAWSTLEVLYPSLDIPAFSSKENILYNLHLSIKAHNFVKKKSDSKKECLRKATLFCWDASLPEDIINQICAYLCYSYDCCDLENVLPCLKRHFEIPD